MDTPEPSSRQLIFAFSFLALAVVVGIVVVLVSRPQPVQITVYPPEPTATPSPSPTPGPITVYVTGAVGQPQSTLSLPAGSRVMDAIDAAGGPLSSADLDRVNVAAVLHDGDQVHVPTAGDEVILPTPNTGGIVHINTATAAELETLPGIGPTLAQRIIDFREQTGPFSTMEDLDLVPGIGPALLAQLEGLIDFD